MNPRCVHVVDDEDAVRRSTQMILRLLGYETKAFESGIAFLEAQPNLARGSVLLDMRMPEIDGLEVQRRLNAAGASHPVIAVSGHGDLGMAATAMEQGAIAFLEKPFSRTALEQVLDLAFALLDDPAAYRSYLVSAAAAVQRLDPPDRRVLELIAEGQDSVGIARQSGLSAAAIELSRARIYAELGVGTLTEVLRWAYAARRAEML